MGYDQYLRLSNSYSAPVQTDGTQTVTFAAAQTVDFDIAPEAVITMTADFTSLTFSGGKPGQILTLKLIQDATGSRLMAGAAATIIWNGTTLYGTTHTAVVLTTTATQFDYFFFVTDGTKYLEIGRNKGNAA